MADPKIKVIVEADDTQAKKLEATLRNLQKAAEAVGAAMTRATDASAKQDAATAKAALASQRLATAQAQTALVSQRVATEAERTAAAHGRATVASERAARAAQRLSKDEADVARQTALGERELAKYEQQLARTATAKGDAARQSVVLRQNVETLLATIRNVTFVAGILGTTFSKAFDYAEQGAQIAQTTVAFDHFATSIAGVPDLLDQLRQGAAGTITDFDLMKNTMTLVAGTTQEAGARLAGAAPQLLEIARAAQILNPALGDVNYFYESLATGIKRLEPRWIDNLGLIVRARDAYATHAKQLGVSTLALTAEQKSQAFLNEVLRVGNLLIEQNGGAVASAVDPYSRFRAEIQETGNALKVFLAEGLLPYIQFLNGEYQAGSAAIVELNEDAVLSIDELSEAYQRAAKNLGVALVPGGTAFVDVDQTIADMETLRTEIARTAGSFEEFIAATTGKSVDQVNNILEIDPGRWEELRVIYEQAQIGIRGVAIEAERTKPATEALTGSMLALQYALLPVTELTEDQIEALAKLREAQADAAKSTIENAGNLTEFQKQLLASADNANLTVGELFRFAEAMGVLSESETEAAQNAYVFWQANARMLAGVAAGTLDFEVYQRQIRILAQRLGIDYQTAAQKATQSTQVLNLAVSLGAGSFIRYGQGLGNAANQALKLKNANDAATQSVQRLATVSAGATSAFINALEGSMGGGGGGASPIEAAAQAQREWNEAFGQSFMQLLDAEKPIENWNAELLKSAAAAGASAETLALLAAATGEYSQEQIASALKGAAMKQAIEEISAALVDGRATTEEALAAVGGFQQQLEQGGSLKLDLQAYGIEELRENIQSAGGGAGSAATETQNWVDNLLKLADQGRLTAADLVLLAESTGKYSDAQVRAALKTLLMQQKLEELSAQIGKRPMQAIIDDLRQFESDLDKEFTLQFGTGEAEEAIGRVHRGLERIPTEINVKINIKADPVPDLGNLPGSQNPNSPDSRQEAQYGGPLVGATLVGEVRPELVVGGQVIPRIPPGFLMAQEGFAQTVAMALANNLSNPPSFTSTTNINRTNTINNNQRQVVINAPSVGATNQNIRREIGAF